MTAMMFAAPSSSVDLDAAMLAVDLLAEVVTLPSGAPGPQLLVASAVSCFGADEPAYRALVGLANAFWGRA